MRHQVSLRDYLALSAFLGVFPLDAAWYVASLMTGLPKLPLGLGTAVLVLAFLLPATLLKYRSFRLLFALLLVFMLFGVAAAVMSPFFNLEWAMLFVWYVVMLTVGFALAKSPILDHRRGRWLVAGSTLFCAVTTILLLVRGFDNSVVDMNYLRPALALTYGGILSMYFLKGRAAKLVVYAAVLGALTLLTSRTFLYLWLMLPFAGLFVRMVGKRLNNQKARKIAWIAAPVLLATGVVLAVVFVLPLLGTVGSNRVDPEAIVADGGRGSIEVTDNSLNVRLQLTVRGWQQILDNPIFGFYDGYLAYADEGSYIHNVLSYWHQFGLIPFLILIGLILASFRRLLKTPRSTTVQCAKLLFLYGCAGILFARAYVATEIFFVIGFALAAAQKPVRGASVTQRQSQIGLSAVPAMRERPA